MKAFAIVGVLVCSVVFYLLEHELYKLKQENLRIRMALFNERFRYEIVEEQLDLYQMAFSRAQDHCPELKEQFDVLINGINPWLKKPKESKTENLNLSEKTTPVNK